MHVHIGMLEFLVFGLYLFLWKAVLLFANIEFRRNRVHIPAAVSGLVS